MSDLRLSSETLEQEKARLLEEVQNMFANFPPLAAQNNARELIRPTPDGGRCGGQPDQVRALRTKDVQEHLGRYYRPRNAIVSIAGAFDPAAARKAISAHFAGLAPGKTARTPRAGQAQVRVVPGGGLTQAGRRFPTYRLPGLSRAETR